MHSTLITGITGQIGSHLAELLLSEGHKVYGIIRRSSNFNTQRIDHIFDNPNLHLVYGDLGDSSSLYSIIGDVKPDFFYNLAAQSHVRVSFDLPEYTADITGTGVVRCLEAIRKTSPKTRFYQASSSELFGSSPPPQNEQTPMCPCSPYAVAKLYGYWITKHYREAYKMFCSNGIIFNTEGKTRGFTFLPKKVTKALGRIVYGLQDKLYLGNLDAKRDWNHVKDSSRAMKMILEHSQPDDFCIGSGKSHSVKDFLTEAFSICNLDWKDYVVFDSKYVRPVEVNHLLADSSKAKKELGWEPQYSFKDLVREMVEYDLEAARKETISGA